MYKLINEKLEYADVKKRIKPVTGGKRTYQSEISGTLVTTELKYIDSEGGKWWTFVNLWDMPATRKEGGKKVADLFSTNVSVADFRAFTAGFKANLRSNDPDKYEKCYADVLRFENLFESVVEYEKQCLALCTIYVLADDEPIELYGMDMTAKKMSAWALRPDVQIFFLNWLLSGINDFMKALY